MPSSDLPLIVRDLSGLNKRDSGERVQNNEFQKIQNLYHATKGFLYKRKGTTQDLSAANLFGASAVTGIHTHDLGENKYRMFHCKPNSTPLTQPTIDLTLQDLATGFGTIFGGGAVVTLRFCYTFVGLGQESNYNTFSRGGYNNGNNVSASAQGGHQTITCSANTNQVKITVPAFPDGVKAVNLFCARGAATNMTYIATVTQSGGTYTMSDYIAPLAAREDVDPGVSGLSPVAAYQADGTLTPGQYYVSFGWLTDSGENENPTSGVLSYPFGSPLFPEIPVYVPQGKNAIGLGQVGPGAASLNGARALRMFIGRKSIKEAPHIWVNNLPYADFAFQTYIKAMPDPHNATAIANRLGKTGGPWAFAGFWGGVVGFNGTNGRRAGFVMIKRPDGLVKEIFTSRSEIKYTSTSGASTTVAAGTGEADGIIKTDVDVIPSDNYPKPTSYITGVGRQNYSEPQFAYFQGSSYMVNGVDLLRMMNDYAIGPVVPEYVGTIGSGSQTITPPIASRIITFNNSILVSGSECLNQVYASNASKSYNWVTGGTGTLLRFVTVGDAFQDVVQSLGIFSFNSATDGPESFFLAFKNASIWSYSSFPDTSGSTAINNISGTIGCYAWRTIVNSPIGPIFLGSDGDIHMMRNTGEPYRIGGRVKSLLEHLAKNPALMRKCTAIFHDDHYKLSYPSSSSSTYNDAQVWADLRTADGDRIQWSGPHTGVNVGAQIALKGEGSTSTRLGCDANAVRTLLLDDSSTYQDLGVSIVSVFRSKRFRYASDVHWKRLSAYHLDMFYDTSYQNKVLMEAFADDDYAQKEVTLSDGAYLWDGSNYDSALWGDADFFPIPWFIDETPLVGRIHEVQMTHSNNAPIVVAGFTLHYRPERRIFVSASA